MKSVIKRLILFFHNLFSIKKRTNRELFLKKLDANGKILEIGPFNNPSLRGENIYYFDVMNKESLVKRAKEENYPSTEIPEINFVSPHGDLTIIQEDFDNIYSSHCIEHQTDFVKHLIDVSAILKPGGKYYLVIPDKRYCFDALLPETNIASILEAYYEKRTRHSFANVIQHGALTTHNIPYRHWLGDHGNFENIPDKIRTVVRQYKEKNGDYFDVHSWRFTPDSFVKLINLLYEMNYIDSTINEIYYTTFASNEFYAVLQKSR